MKNVLLILGATALTLSTGSAQAELALKLDSITSNYLLGEPISVGVTLTNTGGEPVQVFKDLGPEYGAVSYAIRRPDGREDVFSAWAIKEPAELFAQLPPGQSLTDTAPLFFDGANWTFSEPGEYVLRATYSGTVRAAPLTIKVTAPEEPAARDAAQALLASPEAGMFLLLSGGDHLANGVKVLERIADKAQGTPYAAHADLALGLSRVRPFADYANNRLRPADPAAAAKYLERVDVGRLNPTGVATARLALAQAYRAMNEPERAKAIESELPAQLERRFPQIAPSIREQLLPRIERSLKP